MIGRVRRVGGSERSGPLRAIDGWLHSDHIRIPMSVSPKRETIKQTLWIGALCRTCGVCPPDVRDDLKVLDR
jgi:hypothetical protein